MNTCDVQFKSLHECISFYYLGIDVNFKSALLQKSESATTSEAEGFMKRLQTLKMKASVACRVLGGKRNKNNLLDQNV